MHLLLVEDDEMIAEPVVDTMRRAGYVADWVSGVRKAAISLGGEVYDLIMLDPDLSGPTVLTCFRRIETGGAVPL